MKKILSLLLIICSIGVAYADDKSTVTSLKYVTDELNTRQDKFGANDGKAMTFTNVAGGNAPRDVKSSLGSNTSDTGLPTVSAVNTGIATKQDEIGAANTNTVVTYTGTPGTLGQKGIYQDTGTYAAQSDNLIQASTFNAALRNGLNNEFVCADRDPVSNQCWLWTIDNATNETITVHGKNLLNLGAPGVIYGNFINNDGIVTHDNTSTISDFIPCTEGTYYTAQTVARASGSNLRIHGYDENKNWVQMLAKSPASVGVITTATCQIPAEIKYIKVCGYMMGRAGEDAMLEFGSTATPYEPYTEETVNLYIPQNQTAQNP